MMACGGSIEASTKGDAQRRGPLRSSPKAYTLGSSGKRIIPRVPLVPEHEMKLGPALHPRPALFFAVPSWGASTISRLSLLAIFASPSPALR